MEGQAEEEEKSLCFLFCDSIVTCFKYFDTLGTYCAVPIFGDLLIHHTSNDAHSHLNIESPTCHNHTSDSLCSIASL